MPPPVETEIKLELPSSEVARLTRLASLRRASSVGTAQQVSIYFDTNKFALRENGVTFRVRRIGRRYLQTIKAPNNGLLDRKMPGAWL